MQPPQEKDPVFIDVERHLCGTGGVTASDIWVPPGSGSSRSGEPPVVFYVVVFDAHDKKTASYGEVKVLSMNVSGATLVVGGVLEVGQKLLLTNPTTGKQILCNVCSVDPREDGTSHVEVELEAARKKSALKYFLVPARFVVALGIFTTAAIFFAASLHQLVVPSVPARNASGVRGTTYPFDDGGYTGNGDIQPGSDSANPYPLGSEYSLSAAGGAVLFPLPPEALREIPDLAGFRVARAQDFAPQSVSWLSQWRLQASGLIPGNYAGSVESRAYVLLGKDGSWRVVIVGDGQVRCDVRYQAIAIAARVPKEFIRSIQWEGPAPLRTDRDGLLIVRAAADPSSAVVLLLQGNEVVSGSRPVDYRQVPLTHVP